MMKKYKYIIWDWNGTLLDDVWLCVDIINNMLMKRKKSRIIQEQYRRIFEFPVKGYYERAGFDFTTESFELVCSEFCDEYEKRVYECNLYDKTLNILTKSANNNIIQSVLSATKQDILEGMVDQFKVRYFFDRIIGQKERLNLV